jgi:hypothetical protein
MLRLMPLSLMLLTAAVPLSAQARAPQWRSWQAPSLERIPSGRNSGAWVRSAGTPGLVLAGLGGGVVGFFAGGFVGYELGGGDLLCGDDDCGLEEAAYGAIAGESILLPLGVHLANHRRGNYGLSLLASAALGGIGILAVNASNDGTPIIVVPIAQLVTSILIERATAH